MKHVKIYRPLWPTNKSLQMNIKDIKTHLQKFSLDVIEIDTYIALLQNGELSAVEISRKLNIPKTTIYRYIEKLIKEGLVAVIESERGKRYIAITTQFDQIVEERRKSLQDIIHAACYLKQELPLLATKSTNKTTVRVYKGIDGLKQLMWNILSAKNIIYYYTSTDRRKLLGDFFFKKYCLEFVRRNLHERGFESSINAPKATSLQDYYFGTGYEQKSEYKIVKNLDMNGEIWIYNNVYSMYTWEQEEIAGVEIENEYLTKCQRTIFEKLWNETKATEPKLEYILK